MSKPVPDLHVPTADPPPLMDKKELAAWLSVCVTIENWLLEGWLPVIQPSPRIQRFNPIQILASMEELHGRGHGYGKRHQGGGKLQAIF